jgi:hypothetical protein
MFYTKNTMKLKYKHNKIKHTTKIIHMIVIRMHNTNEIHV